MKPKLFIGSSTEGIKIARAIQSNLHYDEVEVTLWNQDVFRLNSGILDTLLAQLEKCDFAVFVFSPDDVVTIRDQSLDMVRDNVVFELGLFLAKLGRERVFFVIPKDVSNFRLPTDLLGIIPGKYDPNRSDGNWRAALEVFCDQLRQEFNQVSSRHSPGDLFNDIVEQMRELLSKHLNTQYVGEFPEFFKTSICECLSRAQLEIRIACDFPNYGSFSVYTVYEEYMDLLRRKHKAGVKVQILILDAKGRRELNLLQFAQREEQWNSLVSRPAFKEKLKKFEGRCGRPIKSLQEFNDALSERQDFAAAILGETHADMVIELNTLMPIYIWMADEKSAVFSIPTFGQDAFEHGFETKDLNLVKALKSIWERYSQSQLQKSV